MATHVGQSLPQKQHSKRPELVRPRARSRGARGHLACNRLDIAPVRADIAMRDASYEQPVFVPQSRHV